MCGIVGIVGSVADSPAADDWMALAMDAVGARGPDAAGTWRDRGVFLGHRRLAVRDLSKAGAQPMCSASGDSVVVYNGEIYDTETLAVPLRARGWRPRGHSDTEVLIEHLEAAARPPARNAALAALVGMFGVAAWHRPTGELTLARDRTGLKPLYVARLPDGLAFCSEPGPLYAAPDVDRTLDAEALLLYLVLGVVPAPWSLGRGVRQLRPGQVLLWNAQQERLDMFASLPRPASPGEVPEDPIHEGSLERLLERVVADQLVSDVPIGVLLSGGVDSSLVAAAAARAGGRLKTFTIVHPDPDYDERDFARVVAQHLGTEHHELELHPGGLTADELHRLVDRTGDPFADSSALPLRRLAGVMRQHVTVALSGDGGDELFAGYPRYTLADRVGSLRHVPATARWGVVRAWGALARHLPPGRGSELARRVARAARLSLRTCGEQAVGTVAYMWPGEVSGWLNPGVLTALTLEDLVRDRGLSPREAPDAWFLHALEQRLILPDDMLVKVDRMSMDASLEIRPPLLDDRVVSAAARVPFIQKLSGGEGKAILRRIARRWVPSGVVDRPKKGFAVPLLAYGGTVLEDAGRWALESAGSPLVQVFNQEGRAALARELTGVPAGRSPEDSAFRLAHRRWLLVLLARAMDHLRIEVAS